MEAWRRKNYCKMNDEIDKKNAPSGDGKTISSFMGR